MMSTYKLSFWPTVMFCVLGLSACQKEVADTNDTKEEVEVTMSAAPAENNDPAIVADDLDEVDARMDDHTINHTDLDVDNTGLAENNADTADTLESSEQKIEQLPEVNE